MEKKTRAEKWGCGCERRAGVPGKSEALLALIFHTERRAPKECRQNRDGWSCLGLLQLSSRMRWQKASHPSRPYRPHLSMVRST